MSHRLVRCLCRAIEIRAEGEPSWVGLCHCESCRRATGGVLLGAAGYPRERVSVTRGTVSYYASSPGVRRGFCSRCGTALSYENQRWAGDIHLMVGAFEAPETLKPQFHLFAQERLPWLHLDDGLARYRTTPSAGEVME
jgi:hypothetical protein